MKKHLHGTELNAKIVNGVNKLADTVASTLGPKGNTVILCDKNKKPILTKDGVSIAEFFSLEDPFEDVGAQVIKQASSQTNIAAGDGTTTSTVLAKAIINKAQKYIAAGVNTTEVKRGMEKALHDTKSLIKLHATPVKSLEDIANIATISANNDKQIGTLISLAIDKAGRDGAVSIEEARSVDTSLDVVEGFQIDSGFLSTQFITDERKGTCRYTDALVLVTDHDLEDVEELLPTLEIAAREKRPLVVIGDDIRGNALAALVMNAVRGNMKVCAVKAPRYGEERRNILADLAVSVGATFVTRHSGMRLHEVKRKDLGFVKTCEIARSWTTFMGGNGNPDIIKSKIEALKGEVERTSDLVEAQRTQERITRLQSAVAIIRVGGLTEVDMIEKKDRVVDALEAVRAAQLEGILAGGGASLVFFSNLLKKDLKHKDLSGDEEVGYKILIEAITEPLKTIASNCGHNPEIILSEVSSSKKFGYGYNFVTGKYTNLLSEGIIDPAKVTRCALENAVSAASTLLTTSHAVIEI